MSTNSSVPIIASIFPVTGKWQRKALVPEFLKPAINRARDSLFKSVETCRGDSEMQSTLRSRVSRPCMKAVAHMAKEILVGTF
jgi:hypothetical protein